MPIIGLTDSGEGFPRIGVLRKGAPKTDPKRPGKNLSFFRFDTTDKAAEQAFAKTYGAEPRHINVYLPYPTVDQNFAAWREHWVGGGLMHRCDGETCSVTRTKDGRYSFEPLPCPERSKAERERLCKPTGRLAVIVPELERLAHVLVVTTSIWDIIELTRNLHATAALRGDLRGIPFVLSRTEREISKPAADGKRIRATEWLLSLEPAPEWVAYQLATQRANALPGSAAIAALPAPSVNGVDITTGEITGPDGDDVSDDYDDVPHNGHSEPPSQEREPITAAPAVSEGQLRRLHQLGVQYYGKVEWDAKRPDLVKSVTGGSASSSRLLTPEEADTLIRGLEKRIEAESHKANGDKTTPEPAPEPEQEAAQAIPPYSPELEEAVKTMHAVGADYYGDGWKETLSAIMAHYKVEALSVADAHRITVHVQKKIAARNIAAKNPSKSTKDAAALAAAELAKLAAANPQSAYAQQAAQEPLPA